MSVDVPVAAATPASTSSAAPPPRPRPQVSRDHLSDGFSALQNFMLYESRTLMVVTGSDKSCRWFRLLTFDRTSPYDLKVSEDPATYTASGVEARVAALIAGSGAPLERTMPFAALLGAIRLPKVFLVLAVTREKVGSIGGRWLYSVGEWKLKAVGHKSYTPRQPPAHSRYKQMVIDEIELGKDYYFSYFYDLTRPLQQNIMGNRTKQTTATTITRAREKQEVHQTSHSSSAAAALPLSGEAPPPQPQPQSAPESEPIHDPIVFDPIANPAPQTRRRSVSSLVPTPPQSTPDRLEGLEEEEEEEDFEEETDHDEPSTVLTAGDTANVAAAPVQTANEPPSSTTTVDEPVTPALEARTAPPPIPPRVARSSFLPAATAPPTSTPVPAPAASTQLPPNTTPPPIDAGVPSYSAPPVAANSSELPPSSPAAASPSSPPPYAEKWLWNLHLAREFLHYLPHGSYWLVPLIHGFVRQTCLRIGRREVLVTLLARRSRHFAGTRYIKRGVSALGHVANEVETEQIVEERRSFAQGGAAFSSLLMLRGSIPLYWAQENSRSPKPEIVVYNFDRACAATRAHFDDCFARYGSPVAVLSLIKKEEKTPQETRLGMAFNHALQRVSSQYRSEDETTMTTHQEGGANNSLREDSETDAPSTASFPHSVSPSGRLSSPASSPSSTGAVVDPSSSSSSSRAFSLRAPPYDHPAYPPHSLLYCTYDFLGARAKQGNVLRDIKGLVAGLVEEIGVFSYVPGQPRGVASVSASPVDDPRVISVQRGVLRVNCIDCLDRTNVGQFSIGKAAVRIQLRSIGIEIEEESSSSSAAAAAADTTATGGILASIAPAHDVYPELVAALQDMYTQHGDRIAHQYAGSGAMHKEILYDDECAGDDSASTGGVSIADLESGGGGGRRPAATGASNSKSGGTSKNITSNALSAIKRYYSNNFSDTAKQSAINVFLGHYMPASGGLAAKPHIWDLDVYSNFQDSDQLFAREADRFRPPFDTAAIGGTNWTDAAATTTVAGVNKALFTANTEHPPGEDASTTVGQSNGLVPRRSGRQAHRFLQYFSEAYQPFTATSFDEELRKPFQAAVVVKLQPADAALTAAAAEQEAAMTNAAAAAAALAAPSVSPTTTTAPTSIATAGVLATTPGGSAVSPPLPSSPLAESPAAPLSPLAPPPAATTAGATTSATSVSPPPSVIFTPSPVLAPTTAPTPAVVPTPATAPAPPVSRNPLKRGFAGLFGRLGSSSSSQAAAAAAATPASNKVVTGTPVRPTALDRNLTMSPTAALAAGHASYPAPAAATSPRDTTTGVTSFATLLRAAGTPVHAPAPVSREPVPLDLPYPVSFVSPSAPSLSPSVGGISFASALAAATTTTSPRAAASPRSGGAAANFVAPSRPSGGFHLPRLSLGRHGSDSDSDSDDLDAEPESLDQARARLEYSAYLDTERLVAAPLPNAFATNTTTTTATTTSASDTAVGITPALSALVLGAGGAGSIVASDLARLTLSHHRLADLLVGHMRDLRAVEHDLQATKRSTSQSAKK